MVKVEGLTRTRLQGMLQLMRPGTTVKAAPYTLLGAYLGATAGALASPRVWLSTLVVCLIVAFGFVINDFRDVAADAVSKPDRPIPSGAVSQGVAGLFAVVLVLIALSVASALGPLQIAFALAAISVAALYSYYLKSTIFLGNATVALLDASIVVFGYLAIGRPTGVIWVVSGLIFLYIFAFEILHNIADREGDASAGIVTVGTRLGMTRAMGVFQCVIVVFSGAAIAAWFFGLASDGYLYTIVPCAILPTLGVLLLLKERTTEYTLRLSIRLMKVIWVLSLLPLVLIKR